jgi:dipeptidyl aminopeptidase/acylaminoacyl peptidase
MARRCWNSAMVDLIPRTVLFGNPERSSPELSPDGRRIAWIAPDEGVLNVFVAPTDAIGPDGIATEAARPITTDRDRGIRAYGFAHDNVHLFYVQDAGGDENWRLYDIDLDTLERRDLTPFEGVQAQIVASDRHFPNELLVGLNKDDPAWHDVYRLDLVTGELEKVLEANGLIGFLADTHLVVRAAVEPQDDGGQVLMVRDDADSPFRPLVSIPADDSMTTSFVAFTPDDNYLLALTSLGAETSRLVRIALANGSIEVLFADDEVDVAGVRLDPETNVPQVALVLRDRMEFHILDPAIASDIEAIRALHPGDAILAGEDDADVDWLVAFTNDQGPVPYFYYRRADRSAQFLFEHQPALSAYELAPMEPFAFDARDGLRLHGYVTFPPGLGREGLPAVLNVHGGPWVRDDWGFDPTAQWLANRGYVCIQVNYRGSTGFGKAFINAGDHEWGGKMHDDLVDTRAFAIAQGWVDAERIGIYGGSYGGYAALVGAAFTPELFACAVDVVGPSNLATLIRTIPAYWGPLLAEFHRRVGNPDTEEAFLWSRSPLSRASAISIPLLIAQGANDPRVKQDESEQIVQALVDAGIPHEYLLFPDEGHGFAKPENRLRFQQVAEAFLAEHLGGRAEP